MTYSQRVKAKAAPPPYDQMHDKFSRGERCEHQRLQPMLALLGAALDALYALDYGACFPEDVERADAVMREADRLLGGLNE